MVKNSEIIAIFNVRDPQSVVYKEYVEKYKREDNILYAIYGTPAESLCGLQIEQFKKKYGIVKGVSDRPYTTNSFHCGVWEDINGITTIISITNGYDVGTGGVEQRIGYCRVVGE